MQKSKHTPARNLRTILAIFFGIGPKSFIIVKFSSVDMLEISQIGEKKCYTIHRFEIDAQC